MKDKIKTREEMIEIVNQLRKDGKKIVTINGSFDLFHYGHAVMLDEAKSQGDVLIVGLNSDESVRNWKKHTGYKDWEKRPINHQDARSGVLASLGCVDYVTLFSEMDSLKFVESIKPDVHVNGADYGKDCIEAKIVREHGGRVHIAGFVDGFSSSKMIKKIVEAYQDD